MRSSTQARSSTSSYVAEGRNRGKFCHIDPGGHGTLIERPNEYASELSLDRRTVILKLHGQVDRTSERAWESFVVTDDHYIEYLARAEVSSVVPVGLAAKLRRSHFLFLGYSLVDWNLRLLLYRLWGDQPLGYRSWAVDDEPHPFELEFWRKHGVDVLDLPLERCIDALGGACRRRDSGGDRLTDAALSAPPTPFKGLAPFGESELDMLLFFGREREIEVIAANLVASRLTVLYGPSGVGKTSLLRAGVVTRLRRDEAAGVVVHANWSGDSSEGLLRAIEEEARRVRPDIDLDLRGRSLAEAMARWDATIGAELYVVLDQFEEYFLYHESGGPFEELAEIIRDREHRANFLISIREDALAQLDAFKTQIPNLFGNSLRLDRLDRQAAKRAILGPIERYNELAGEADPVVADDELVDEVLDSVQTGRIQLGPTGRGGAEDAAAESGRIEAPYLQLVLERLWNVERERGSSRLQLTTLRELGGATRIVEEHLERAMSILSPEEQDAAAAMYNHLVTPSGTKIAHRAGDLARYASVDEAQAGTVLDRLARERIIRAAEDGAAGPQYEIFHDVLLTPCWHGGRSTRPTVASRRSGWKERDATAVCSPSPADRWWWSLSWPASPPMRSHSGGPPRRAPAKRRPAPGSGGQRTCRARRPQLCRQARNGASRLPSRRAKKRARPRWRTHSGAR